MPQRVNPIYVAYQDHAGGATWEPLDRVDLNPLYIESIGWVLYEDETTLVLTASRTCHNESVTVGRAHIVKSCIVRREEVGLYNG